MKIVSGNKNYLPPGNKLYKQEKEPEVKIKEKHTNMTDITSEEKNKETSFAYVWYSLFDCSLL